MMFNPKQTSRSSKGQRSVQGFTLIELMVSIVLMLLVTIATVALYSVNSQSSKTVDTVAALDDSARFIFDVMGRTIQTAGYREVVRTSALVLDYSSTIFDGCVNTTEPCPLIGFDNSVVAAAANNYGSAGSGVINSSDSLVVRYAGGGTPGGAADGSSFDCLGSELSAPLATGTPSTTRQGMAVVGFYLGTTTASLEPELFCRTRDEIANTTTTQQLATGVETLQLLYAIDTDSDSVPNRWVRATNVTNWTQVRAVRVGFVLRGEIGSAQTSSTATLYPLGKEFSEGLAGDALYAPPSDSRLRKAFSATFFMRNEL